MFIQVVSDRGETRRDSRSDILGFVVNVDRVSWVEIQRFDRVDKNLRIGFHEAGLMRVDSSIEETEHGIVSLEERHMDSVCVG